MLDKSKVSVNLMKGRRPICENLLKYYQLDSSKKKRYLKDKAGFYLLNNIDSQIAGILERSFLNGFQFHEIPENDGVDLVNYFQENSEIIPILTAEPGDFQMLERMYHFQEVQGVIDNYFLQSVAGGQALRHRYLKVNQELVKIIDSVVRTSGFCSILDFGSGPSRNLIDLMSGRSDLANKVKIDCVDIDDNALSLGRKMAAEKGLTMMNFINGDMVRLNGTYKDTIDLGVLVGVLCGMDYQTRVKVLRIFKRCFKSGGIMVAAALLEEMAKKDLLCAYILREITGWHLEFRPLHELQKVFQEAGWKYRRYFQEETGLYEIGVAIA